jgi:hypothetical protein
MHIEVLEKPGVDVIAREDASDGEFYIRDDASVWYRNELAPGEDCFVNADRAEFLRAVEALHRYNSVTVNESPSSRGCQRRRSTAAGAE